MEKLKCLEKLKKKVALKRKAKLLETEISRMSISDDIRNMKEVEDSNSGGSHDYSGSLHGGVAISACQVLLKKHDNTVLQGRVSLEKGATGDSIGVGGVRQVKLQAGSVN